MEDPIYHQAPCSSAYSRWSNEPPLRPDYTVWLKLNESKPISLKREDSKNRLRSHLLKKEEVWRETVLDAEKLDTYDEIGEPSMPIKEEKAFGFYSYSAQSDDESTLDKGDIGWSKGKLRGKIGVFRSNCVEIIKRLKKKTKNQRPIEISCPIQPRNERNFRNMGRPLPLEPEMQEKTKNKPPISDTDDDGGEFWSDGEFTTDESDGEFTTDEDVPSPILSSQKWNFRKLRCPLTPEPERQEETNNKPSITVVDGDETDMYEIPKPPLPPRVENSKNKPAVKEKTHRYEHAVFLFERFIINTVNVKQILPYLHSCIKHSDIEQLRRMSEIDKSSAATKLLQLLQSSDEPGKWKALVEAFEKTGNKLLENVMRKLTVADNEEQKKILHMVLPELRQQIQPSELIPYLKAQEIITGEDAEEILAKERIEGCIAAADLLVECIPKKHPEWFERLLNAFSECGRQDLKDILELGMEKEVKSDAIEALKHVSNKRKMSDTSTLTNSLTVVKSVETEGEKENEYEERQEREERKNIFDENQDEKTSLKMCDVESATLESNSEAANFIDAGTGREYSTPYSKDTKCRENESTSQHFVDKHNGTTSETTVIDIKQTDQIKTKEQKPNNAHENLSKSTQKIGYTQVVINGVVCIADETQRNGIEPDQHCVDENVNKAAIEYVPESIKELRKLREDSCNEIQMLELEISERKVISKSLDRKNELLRKKRVLLDSFALKSKEEAALKAAMSEDKARRPERGSTYVEDIDTYMYSAHRNSSGKLTIEYRNNDMILFDPTLYQKDNGQVVKIYDAASSCKDSAFYSDGSDYGIKPVRTIFLQ